MKKENNKNKQRLSSQSSSLIVIVSCISVLMLMAYFGVSLTSKGTYSANGEYSCSTGVMDSVSGIYKCCPSDYPTLEKVSSSHELYLLGSGYVCHNSNYNDDVMLSNGNTTGYCLSTLYSDVMTGPVNCPANGGIYEAGSGCYLPCAKAPLGDATFTETVCTYTYQGQPSGSLVTIRKSDDSCGCPSGGWTGSTTNMNLCTIELSHSDSTNSTSYLKGGMTGCATGYDIAADGRCRKCDDEYEFSDSSKNSCSFPEDETDPSCAYGSDPDNDGTCEVHCVAGIPGLVGSPSKTSCENVYKGYTCTEQTAYVFTCSGAKPTCSVTINDCIIQADSVDTRFDADVRVSSPVNFTYKWEVSGNGYNYGVPSTTSSAAVGTTHIFAPGTVHANSSGTITAKVTVQLGTGGSCSATRNITVTACSDCGGSGDLNVQRCYKNNSNDAGTIVTVNQCSMSSTEINACGDSCKCNGSFTNTVQGTCNITYSNGTTAVVQRCGLDDVPTCNTTPTPTEKKTCYRCNATSTTPDEREINADEDCSSGWSTTRPTCKKTCYKCNATSTTPDESEINVNTDCPSGWSTTIPTCKKTCKYCSNGQVTTNTNVPSGMSCSSYNPNYHETSETLTCSTEKKTCYKCNATSTTPDEREINADEDCSSGWSTTRPNCKKTCKYCSNGQVTTNTNVPSGTACSAYNANYHETTENLTCSDVIKCCECNGNNKVEKGDSTDGNCPSGQTRCDQIVCRNAQTGSTAIIIAWIVGILAIGYSFYYFRQTNKR